MRVRAPASSSNVAFPGTLMSHFDSSNCPAGDSHCSRGLAPLRPACSSRAAWKGHGRSALPLYSHVIPADCRGTLSLNVNLYLRRTFHPRPLGTAQERTLRFGPLNACCHRPYTPTSTASPPCRLSAAITGTIPGLPHCIMSPISLTSEKLLDNSRVNRRMPRTMPYRTSTRIHSHTSSRP